MSIASLGIASSLASSALTQRTAETDKSAREASDQLRAIESVESAARAGGIGQTEQDSEASDRDADGRRLWEETAPASKRATEPTDENVGEGASKDPSGACGGLLDLVG